MPSSLPSTSRPLATTRSGPCFEPDFFVGLDLGKTQDYTALAVLERSLLPPAVKDGPALATYGVRHLQRWPLGTAYTVIVPAVPRRM